MADLRVTETETAESDHEHAPPSVGGSRPGRKWAMGWTQAVLLLGLGLHLAYLYLSENVANYIHVRFAWLAAAGAVFCLALGGHALWVALRASRSDAEVSHDHAGHTHPSRQWPTLGWLAVPLVLGTLVPPQPLGAAAVGGNISAPPTAREAPMLLTSDSLQWTVADWLRMFASGGTDRLRGQPADVTGFVYRREGDPEGYFVVARFLMVHCTADAYAVGIPVRWTEAKNLPTDAWVRVRGTVEVGEFRGNQLPILTATTIDDQSERPKQAYLYQ
jgi:putative membrane protein